MPTKNKAAFSLIELAVVVVIIGFLIIGVIGGSSLIRSSTINSARSFTVKSSITSITGLVAWYETSLNESLKRSESYQDQQISTWYDVSPGSIVAARNTLTTSASNALIYQEKGINDIPSLRFSSSGKLTLSSFYQGALTQSTVFLVFRPTSSLGVTLLDSYSTGSTSSIGVSSTTIDLNAGSSVSTSTASNSASFTIGNDYILAAYFSGSSSKAYANNVTTSAGNASVSPGSNQLSGLTIGTNKSGSSAFTGLISEVIIFNRVLQIQERRDVFKYLSYKYKISVTGI
ncbi:MAG: hypothetical protein EBS06_02240 [Proteobacteria bacterium]|nr:hypothetical protein [Pseudomonadota bacterium]